MSWRLIGIRLLALGAMAVSTGLFVDQFRRVPAFCSFQGGCGEISRTAFGQPLGIPLPLLGLAGFGGLFALTLVPETRVGRWLGPLSIGAGLAGLLLIVTQVFWLRKLCPLCLVVDGLALLIAAVELAFPPVKAGTLGRVAHRGAWGALAAVSLGAPIAWAALKPPPEVPRQVRALWDKNKLNVVEITDFACPYCSDSHPELRAFLADHEGEVNFIRIVAPLDDHEHSLEAAKAYLSAARQGRGEEMADALFAARDLSPGALVKIARTTKLDLNQFRADLEDDTLNGAIEQTLRWVQADDSAGLPQFWIQNVPLFGAQTRESLEAALARAERPASK